MFIIIKMMPLSILSSYGYMCESGKLGVLTMITFLWNIKHILVSNPRQSSISKKEERAVQVSRPEKKF